jgi:hypothetical protein
MDTKTKTFDLWPRQTPGFKAPDLWPSQPSPAPLAPVVEPAIHNGSYTIENSATGEHRTFRIRTQPADSRFAPGERVVALLVGPDNSHDFQGFGFVKPDGITVFRSKRGDGKKSAHEVYAAMLWSLARLGEGSPWHKRGYRILASRTCLRCNRKLTTPDSIKMGIGPECRLAM